MSHQLFYKLLKISCNVILLRTLLHLHALQLIQLCIIWSIEYSIKQLIASNLYFLTIFTLIDSYSVLSLFFFLQKTSSLLTSLVEIGIKILLGLERNISWRDTGNPLQGMLSLNLGHYCFSTFDFQITSFFILIPPPDFIIVRISQT